MNKKFLNFFTGDLSDKGQQTKKQPKEKSVPKTVKEKPTQDRNHANRIFSLLMLAVACLGLFFGQKLLAKREADKAAQQRNQIMDSADQKRKNADLQRQLQQNQHRKQGQHHQGQNGNHIDSPHYGSGMQQGGMQGTQPRKQNQGTQGGMAPGPKVKAQMPPMIRPNKRQ